LLGSTVALVASLGGLAAPHFASAPKPSRQAFVPIVVMFPKWRYAVSFSTRKKHHFFPCLHAGRMRRQRLRVNPFFWWMCNCEQRTRCSGVTLPLTWRVGRLVPFQSGSMSSPSAYPLRVRQMQGVLRVRLAD